MQTSPIVFDIHEAVACVLTPLSGAETRRWRAILAREQRASALHPADVGDQVEYNNQVEYDKDQVEYNNSLQQSDCERGKPVSKTCAPAERGKQKS